MFLQRIGTGQRQGQPLRGRRFHGIGVRLSLYTLERKTGDQFKRRGNWQLATGDGDKQNRFHAVLCDLCALCGKRLGASVCINDGGIVDYW